MPTRRHILKSLAAGCLSLPFWSRFAPAALTTAAPAPSPALPPPSPPPAPVPADCPVDWTRQVLAVDLGAGVDRLCVVGRRRDGVLAIHLETVPHDPRAAPHARTIEAAAAWAALGRCRLVAYRAAGVGAAACGRLLVGAGVPYVAVCPVHFVARQQAVVQYYPSLVATGGGYTIDRENLGYWARFVTDVSPGTLRQVATNDAVAIALAMHHYAFTEESPR